MRVTGSETVGLIPKKVLIDAADYYLRKQERSLGITEAEKVKIAIKSLGLDDLAPFNPREKVIEYMLEDEMKSAKLIDLTARGFAEETSAESPAPGGGSVAAYCGALGISLATMVANLSAHKRGWDDRWEEFSDWAEKGMAYQEELLHLVDADTDAFNAIMDAFGMPKASETEKTARTQAIQNATKNAIEIPFKTAQVALNSMEVIEQMATIGNPNSITDAGVGIMCARTAVLGAIMNVKINMADLHDKEFVSKITIECDRMTAEAEVKEREVRALVEASFS